MGFADKYITKKSGKYFFEPTDFPPLKMIVVIPCYNEPDIRFTLSSLFDCEYPGEDIGIVVVVNCTENSSEKVLIQNRETFIELNTLSSQLNSFFHLFVIEVVNLPEKHGGVGWARKIGMDWAVVLFNHFGYDNGIILSLDADTLVEQNYLTSVSDYFGTHPEKVAATINFEHTFHPFDLRTEVLEEASAYYELYMRYYHNALSFTGFPHSIYTVGSCFAVKARAYIAQGGMNRKKAGEDFYFLHKMAMLGEIGEINTTTVYPSSRASNRVPFGTGPAIQRYCDGNLSIQNTYPLEAFQVLKLFFSNIERIYFKGDTLLATDFSDDTSFICYCNETRLYAEIGELKANCSSVDVFRKRFFHAFNAFRVLKWLNYSLLHGFPYKSLLAESRKLLLLMEIENDKIPTDIYQILILFRSLDKATNNINFLVI